MLKLFLIIYSGLEHAFEADHLIAVNSLVTNRNKVTTAVKDGIYWGIGHTATIFCVGLLMIGLKYSIDEKIFSYFEAGVGGMLIVLGIFRLVKMYLKQEDDHHDHQHKAAFGVGLIHGLAGSGALVVVVLSQMKSTLDGLLYIIIFGLGSIIGMLAAAGLFSVPYSKTVMKSERIQIGLTILSSLLCVFYGAKVIFDNLSH
jgi:high-affinity nickel permease